MHDDHQGNLVEEVVLYDLDYPLYIEWSIWIMLVSSFFWAFGIPIYVIAGALLNTYNLWLMLYGLWLELSYEKLRYCQTGSYPNCTIQLENEALWEWYVYPFRRHLVQWILYIAGFVWMASYPFFGGFVNIGICYLMYFDQLLY